MSIKTDAAVADHELRIKVLEDEARYLRGAVASLTERLSRLDSAPRKTLTLKDKVA